MKTINKVETNIDNLYFSYWEDETETVVPLTDEEGVKELLRRDDWKEKLIDAIEMTVQTISEEAGRDLEDIWKRQDKIEQRLDKLENLLQ